MDDFDVDTLDDEQVLSLAERLVAILLRRAERNVLPDLATARRLLHRARCEMVAA